ncbi:MAG: DNA-directed RNA polymerase subunit omega [bacterium]|nr:DNA-directed RNA polymerase subunit omega [bacterium]
MDRTIRAPQYAIPDDPEQSTYRYIIVTAKRARQLQDGSRSFLPTTSRKPTVTAMEEVRRGLVKYDDPSRDAEQQNGEGVAEESL